VSPWDVLAIVLCAAVGYAVGSLPVSAWVGGAAGVNVFRAGERNPGSTNVWKLAGPGWGLLAFTADLSKGVLPVALATVTWSWGAGWAAGLGALTGACWPALGRIPGGRGGVVFAGAAFAMAPPAGILSLLLALAVLGGARLLGRNGRVAATAVGIGMYPLLFFAAYRDPLRLVALMALYLVAMVRYVTTRRGPTRRV
jgi:glycerol-3-phosphate acyltransferase PlsY